MSTEELLLDRVQIEEYIFEVYHDKPEIYFSEVKQVHGTNIVLREEILEQTEADGIVSHNSSYPIAIKTADCLPVAFMGNKGIAMVHAGWKGLKNKIFNSQLLINLRPSIIYIGPHIKKCCYQVEPNFHKNIEEGGYFNSVKEGQDFFDLTGLAIHQLKELFPRAKIYVSKTCTHCNDRYNSHRRDKTDKRNYNILSRRG